MRDAIRLRAAPPLLLLLFLAPGVLAASASVEAQDDGSGGGPAYRFAPNRLVVAPGTEVAVKATGQEPHTLTPVQAGAWTEVVVQKGETKTFTAPTAPGEYRFYCKFHASAGSNPDGEMAGVLVVQEGGAPATTTATPTGAATTPTRDAPLPALPLLVGALVLLALARRRVA